VTRSTRTVAAAAAKVPVALPSGVAAVTAAALFTASPAAALEFELDVSSYPSVAAPAPVAPKKTSSSSSSPGAGLSASSVTAPDINVDPKVIGGGLAVLAGVAGLANSFSKPSAKALSAKQAYAALAASKGGAGPKSKSGTTTTTGTQSVSGAPGESVLIDVRNSQETKSQGSPNVKASNIAFLKVPGDAVVPDETFVNKVAAKYKQASVNGTKIIIIDADGSVAGVAARALVAAGLPNVAFVSGGVKAWEGQGLPFRAPSKQLKLDFNLKGLTQGLDNLAEDLKETPTLTKGAIAVGALGAGAFVLFNEVESVLELLGAFAIGQFAVTRLLFADTREETIGTIRKTIYDDIAPESVGEDLVTAAKALLSEETPVTTRASPSTSSSTTGAMPAPVTPAAAVDPENVTEAREWINKWKQSN